MPAPPALIPVPPVRQSREYTCGPASLQSVLAYYGKSFLAEGPLARKSRANYQFGTEETDLKRVARQSGLKVSARHDMTLKELRRTVQRGIPVIVGYQAWTGKRGKVDWRKVDNDGHYSVVIGMDRQKVWLMDPYMDLGKRGYIPIKEFMERWHWHARGKPARHFGMVLRSDRPPALRAFVDGVGRVR